MRGPEEIIFFSYMILLLFWLLAGLQSIACLYYGFTLYAARRFFRQPWPAQTSLPPVTLLKPLKGASAETYEHLASFCRLDYPTFQMLCGVRDPSDPAIAVVQRLQKDFPQRDIVLVVNPEVLGANYKVSTLHHLSHLAKHDIFVITDSDVSVAPECLRRIIPLLADPHTGLVTCLYRGGAVTPFFARLESLLINTGFAAMILVAAQIEKTTYAFGAAMAVKRQALDQIGGFLALADYLADDYHLGNLVSHAGYTVRIAPHVVETHPSVASCKELWRHQLRWARTQRICRAGGYFGTLIIYGTVWALLGVLFFPSSIAMWQLALMTIGLRLYTTSVISDVFLDAAVTRRYLWLVPLTDILSFVIWCASLRGNTVHWGEYTFRVQRDGKMVRVG
ncbi:MAG TPA: bacteriohopanetetrol glucosamine biosynthesis glycosyltransferase HpnI [Methylomirabilota bacterium]|nr:bacteriohopanetetrol glucosamine biosynthesis glycosyltransferase HpnI [Methylomirabilota bacterium]